MSAKIATCCFCGARAALVIDRGRHELSCATCGAPLRNLKALRVARDRPPRAAPPPASSTARAGDRPARPARRKRRALPLLGRVLRKIVDEIEDVFD